MLTDMLTCAELKAGDNINSNAGITDKRQDFESMIFSAVEKRVAAKILIGSLYREPCAVLISGLRSRL